MTTKEYLKRVGEAFMPIVAACVCVIAVLILSFPIWLCEHFNDNGLFLLLYFVPFFFAPFFKNPSK